MAVQEAQSPATQSAQHPGQPNGKTQEQCREDRRILNAYKYLVKDSMHFTSKEDRRQIRQAFEFAAEAHRDARRKSGEPFILHPLAVARIVVKELRLHDTRAIQAALLHDTVEDTELEVGDIQRNFGQEVASIVDGLTKIYGVFDLTTTSKQAENFRKMLMTLSDDIRVALVKIADRLHNMRTLDSMKRSTQLKIASETSVLYAPLAHRLGLYNVKSELDDLVLRFTQPDIYYKIKNRLKASKTQRDKYIQGFIRPLREKMSKIGLKTTIKGRVKSISSIYEKMQRQDIDFEQVYDIFAVRIVIDSQGKSLREQKSDCWKAYNGITSTYRPHPERLRDWLSVPKANGYMALHTTVMGPQGRWVEVQIRSEEMDEAAEKGLAAHWRYKETGSMADASFEQWLDKIRDLLENQQMSAQDFVHEVKSSLVNEEIYVFTPKGDLKILPSGATVLDFAYHIHTNLGDTCIGAKVNQKLEPQNYQLKNGDQVEVISSPRQQPVEEWLNYTVTSRAKSKIKESLKEQRRTIAARGKEIFDRKARQYNVDENHQAVKELLAEFRIPTINDLYYRLGNRQIDVQRLSDFIYRKQNQREVYDQYQNTADYAAYRNREFNDFLQRTLGHDADGLIIDDYIKAASYTFAGCCNPIPGDEIIGFVDPEAGVYIHRTNCQEAMELMSSFGSKVVKANWGAENFVEFLAGIRIIGEDYKGMLNKIVRVISLESRKNIRGFTIDSGGGTFEGQIKLYVNDTEDLHKVMKELERIKGVHGVSRLTSSHQRHH